MRMKENRASYLCLLSSLLMRRCTVIATTEPCFVLTASDLMSRSVVAISQDASLHAAVELFSQRQIGEAAVVDGDGRCVGILAATDLLRWAVRAARGGAEVVPPLACPYQVKGRLLTGAMAVICTRAQGSCSLQELRPMTGGRHTAVCMLPEGMVSDWQEVNGGGLANTVRRSMTAKVATVGAGVPLSALARAVMDAQVHRLIVVDEQHRPIGTVSCLDVLAALARCRTDGAAVKTA
jgi:CBS-domain-containing membrane protein